ncbi:hypothetical protein GOBAR_DD29542 [Gossypium barbadense]|nr:hypothetical protein GOBAR_DD29542 [Gossypium barbadense]
MEVITGTASNLVAGVVGYLFQKVKRNFSYVCRYRRMVSVFEKKVETLKDKRDGVLLDVDAAEKNGENIYPEVNLWLAKADKMTDSELKEVKGLENEANNKCFIGLCPNFKARYRLSKKAEEEAAAVDELLQQGGFDKVSYRDVPRPILFVPPKDFEDFDSRRLMFNNIMEAVKDPNVNIIGVHGMPGVGKTTLVREVVRQVKEDKLFDSVVMAVVTHTPDVQKIQDQIADMLGLKFEEQSRVTLRRGLLVLHRTLKSSFSGNPYKNRNLLYFNDFVKFVLVSKVSRSDLTKRPTSTGKTDGGIYKKLLYGTKKYKIFSATLLRKIEGTGSCFVNSRDLQSLYHVGLGARGFP